ncbi:MAG: hypothetical protein SPD81_11430, partial [Candidatus Faecousia sp.]|nr:hypothetical protein [Candidatus Faecousia sp.]
SHSCKQENPKIQGKVCCLNRTAATLTAAAACYFLFIFLVYLTRGGSAIPGVFPVLGGKRSRIPPQTGVRE